MNWNGLTIVSRKGWGARTPKARTPQTLGKASTLFVHWSAGTGLGPQFDTFNEQAAAVRAVQNFHMDGHGWSDIAYGYVIAQPSGRFRLARIFEGRGHRAVPASQEGYNTGNTSVCVLMKQGEPLKRSTVRRIKSLYKRLPCGNVSGHRDVGSTSCPGDLLYAALPQIRKAK